MEAKLDEFEAKNANKHVETMEYLQGLNEALDFLTHKEYQTEKDVYTIKKKLEIVR